MLKRYFEDEKLLKEANKLKEEIQKMFDKELSELDDNIKYVYDNYKDLTYEDKLSFLYGASLVEVYDTVNYADTIYEENYYDYLNNLFDKITFDGNRKLIEFGIDEIFFYEHFVQISDAGYFRIMNDGEIRGRNLFEEVHKLEKLEWTIINKYPNFLIIHGELGNARFNNIQEWILDVYDKLKNKSLDECMQIMAASYYLKMGFVVMEKDIDLQLKQALKRFDETNLIPKEFKTQIARNYISEGYDKIQKEKINRIVPLKEHTSLIKYKKHELYDFINDSVDHGVMSYEEYEDISNELESYTEYFTSPYILHAILLINNNIPVDDTEARIALLYGASMLYSYEAKNPTSFKKLDEATYIDELDKRFDYYKDSYNDVDDLYKAWIRLGMDCAFYDVHYDEVSKNNDFWIHKLKDKSFGENLFYEAKRTSDIYNLFITYYPNAKIIDNTNGYDIVSIYDWIINNIPGFCDLSIEDSMEYLSAEYFVNQISSVSKGLISKEDIWTLYKRSNIIPNNYKNEVAYNAIFEIEETKKEDEITKLIVLH